MKQGTVRLRKIRLGKLIISRKIFFILCIGVVAVLASFYYWRYSSFPYAYSFLSPRNLAAEVAKPLEEALVKAGGVKKCERGDRGVGGDNWRPSYGGGYQLQVGRQKAVEIVEKIGQDSGYNLKTDKSLDDINADILLLDSTSRKSPYGELQDGNVYMSGLIDRYGEDFRCGTEPLTTSESQTTVWIEASLPDRKK